MTRLAIFDCDGTLVDSQANICRAVEQAFAEARIAVPPRDAIRRIVGLSLVEAMQALLPQASDADHRTLAQCYKDKFVAMRASGALDEEPLFDGIGDLGAQLREHARDLVRARPVGLAVNRDGHHGDEGVLR